MFAANNIMRRVGLGNSFSRRLNIILVNLQDEDYIQKLCALLDHKFFIINNYGAWNSNLDIPANLRLLPNLSSVEYFDLVICFDRAKSFDIARNLSATLNINSVLIDLAPKDCLIKFPVLISPEISDEEDMVKKTTPVIVSTNQTIKDSWGENSSIHIDINIPYHFNRDIDWKNNKKIFIDPILPMDYIKQIPDKIKPHLTFNANEAYCYLHMWKTVTSTMVDCLANSLPVLKYQNTSQMPSCCLDIESLNDISEDLKLKFEDLDLTNNAKQWVRENFIKISEFKDKWNTLIKFVSMQFFKGY